MFVGYDKVPAEVSSCRLTPRMPGFAPHSHGAILVNHAAPSTIFPINQPSTFRYTDAQGIGSITFADLGLDQGTGFDLLRVTIAQNGATFDGSGIATPIPGAAGPMRDLVSFTVVGPHKGDRRTPFPPSWATRRVRER